MRRCSAILELLTLFVFLPVCYGDNETMSSSTPAPSVTPSTTSAMMLIITIDASTPPTSSAVLSTTPTTPSVSPTTTAVPPDNDSIPVLLIEWIRENPIITGLSGVTLILSLLLVCMCYLWCCKKQKITVYEIVDINKSDCGEDPSDGEVMSNPWAGHNGTAATTTEPDTDNDLELQTTQANSVVVRVTDHDQEMDTVKEQQENQETVTVDMQEEIPQMDSMTIDWPEELGSLTNLS